MEPKYDFSLIPASWKFCFNGDCPLRDTCLRFQTGRYLPADYEWGQAIFPSALKDGKCHFYRKDEKVLLATGFVVANNARMNADFVQMRRRLTGILGGNGTYYLYRNGKKWLSPDQQRRIQNAFKKAGYEGEVVYGQYWETYDFS